MELDINAIGSRIKARWNELGLKQSQIYKEVGISSGRLSDLESGKHSPSLITLYRLSLALNCPIDWIITGQTYTSDATIYSVNGESSYVVEMFNKLTPYDQEEIIELMKLKIRRIAFINRSWLMAKRQEEAENTWTAMRMMRFFFHNKCRKLPQLPPLIKTFLLWFLFELITLKYYIALINDNSFASPSERIFNKRYAGPVGCVRPLSHASTVFWETPI